VTPRRVGLLAGVLTFAALAAFVIWHAAQRPPETDEPILLAIVETLILGAPSSVAVAIVAGRTTAALRGRDRPARLLSVATAGLPSPRAEWGAAMRAELAAIDHPADRHWFAMSAGWAAIRSGIGPRTVTIALAIGLAAAGVTVVLSRLSLADDRTGILLQTLFVPPVVLFGVSAIAARAGGTFRAGIELGGLALVALFAGIFGAAMAEAAVWFDALGVYVLDGDAPKRAIGLVDAILDPIAPTFVVLHLALWAPPVVLGATLSAPRQAGRALSIRPAARR
jgi:hypothetical protein